jgi:hypothetical protein
MDDGAGLAGTTRPHPAAIFPLRPIRHPAGPPPVHGCDNLNTGVCARCRNHANRTGAYGVSGVAGVSGASPGEADDDSGGHPAGQTCRRRLRIRRFPAWSGWLAGSPDGCPVRTGGAADRAWEPGCRLDRRPLHGPVVTLGMCHWDTRIDHGARVHRDNRRGPFRFCCWRGPRDHWGASRVRTA